MLESGSSGSVWGVLSNEHPYREPGPEADHSNRYPASSENVLSCRSVPTGHWVLACFDPQWPNLKYAVA
jgi:hypothetical protein